MTGRNPGVEPVECAEVVYRALYKTWVQGERIASVAFMRRIREPEPESALSLSRQKYTTARECRLKLRGMTRAASLHVGRVRDLKFGLDVLPDPEHDREGNLIDPGHCLLINLPHPVNDEEAAEVVASQLIKIARYVTPEQEEQEEQEHQDRHGTPNHT